MAENINIETITTAGYSPWSNGLLERHNQTLTKIILKVKRENGCDWHTALDWALMAKNSMLNVHGYSPYQLVFGQNPNLPSVLVHKLPALEGTTVSAKVGKAFTEAESSERIRRALRKQLRPTDDMYVTCGKVYYKRVDCPEWKGSGVVIGQDGAFVFVRHGGTLVRVHQSRLSKTNAQDQESQDKQNEQDNSQKVSEKSSLNDVANDSDSEENISDRVLNIEVVYPRMTQTETDHDMCVNPVSSAGVKLTTGQTVTVMSNFKQPPTYFADTL